jgi:hypothetical protein
MAIYRKRPALGNVAFPGDRGDCRSSYGFHPDDRWRFVGWPAPAYCLPLYLFGLVLLAIPVLLVSAIVIGHISRHRDPQDHRGRYALIIGYCVLGSVVGLAVLSVLTFMSIRS